MKKPRILAVDDNQEILAMTERMLRLEGYSVDTASDGTSALESVEKNQPDLVLLDVMMPGMDGFQVLERLRKRSRVPVIMLTARKGPDSKAAALLAGADDYLTKPFGARELVARIRAKLRRAGAAPEDLGESPTLAKAKRDGSPEVR